MADQETIQHQIAVYSTDFRWSGKCAVPAHRRLSDFVKDVSFSALVLTDATPAAWENGELRELPQTQTIALLKRNLLLIVSKSDPPLPSTSQFERIHKDPFSVIMFVPPYTLAGDIRFTRNADWLQVAISPSDEFFPVTQANVWHIQSRTKIETDAKLVLVNRHWLLGVEPKR